MSDPHPLPSLLIVGTDTDAGKTTLASLLLHAGPWSYWKPVQSGDPDTGRIRARVPKAQILDPVYSFDYPAAPDVAAKKSGASPPDFEKILAATPDCADRPILVESLGGPLSPLTEDHLQIEWMAALDLPAVLAAPNRVGTINACLTNLQALRNHGVRCLAIVLFGDSCEANAASLRQHGGCPVFEVPWPTTGDLAEETPEQFAAASATVRPLIEALEVDPTPSERPGGDPTLRALDEAHVWHPYSPLREADDRPICLRTEAEWLHLDTGEVLVDSISSWWTCIHGHAHPRIRAALAAAARDHDQVIFAGLAHEPAVRLADELLASMGPPYQRVFYSDNGSTSVEVALKIVHGAWRRRGVEHRNLFLCFDGAYHGDTFGTMAIGRDPVFFAEFEEMLFEVVQIPMEPGAVTDATQKFGDRLAGIILEPLIQAASGMRFHDPASVKQIGETARAAGLPVIFDEVMTGFGRTGTMFAYQQLDEFRPDVVCLAKGLSGGVLPLGATVVAEDLCTPWDSSDRGQMLFHGHSFAANPLACATGRAGLAMFREGTPMRGAARIEAFWREQFGAEILAGFMRICGTVLAFECGAGGYLSNQRQQIIQIARESGVFLRPLGDTVYAMPPLCTSDAGLERIAAALRKIAAAFTA